MYCTSGKMTDKNKSLPYCRRKVFVGIVPPVLQAKYREKTSPTIEETSCQIMTMLARTNLQNWCLLQTVINAPKKEFPFGLVIFSYLVDGSHFGSRLKHRCRICGLLFHLFFADSHITSNKAVRRIHCKHTLKFSARYTS